MKNLYPANILKGFAFTYKSKIQFIWFRFTIMKLPYWQDYVKVSNLVPSKITKTKVSIENCLAAVISQTKSHLFKNMFLFM